MTNLQPGPELDRNMPESRDLDALVAQKIFGYGPYYPSIIGNNITAPNSTKITWLPRYSTDISDAWMVVEEMQRRGWDYLASSLVNGNHAMRFDKYSIVSGQEVESSARAEAPTLPHAVCKAALRALEGQEDET